MQKARRKKNSIPLSGTYLNRCNAYANYLTDCYVGGFLGEKDVLIRTKARARGFGKVSIIRSIAKDATMVGNDLGKVIVAYGKRSQRADKGRESGERVAATRGTSEF